MDCLLKTIALGLCCMLAGASFSDDSAPLHLQQALLIAHQIDQSHNDYAHKGCFIKWKGENGATEYRAIAFACSALVRVARSDLIV
jgi:hypothetical protein